MTTLLSLSRARARATQHNRYTHARCDVRPVRLSKTSLTLPSNSPTSTLPNDLPTSSSTCNRKDKDPCHLLDYCLCLALLPCRLDIPPLFSSASSFAAALPPHLIKARLHRPFFSRSPVYVFKAPRPKALELQKNSTELCITTYYRPTGESLSSCVLFARQFLLLLLLRLFLGLLLTLRGREYIVDLTAPVTLFGTECCY